MDLVPMIVTAVFGLLSLLLGVKWSKALKIIKEVGELISAVSDAAKDNKLSKEEWNKIEKEFKDVIALIKKK